MRYVTTCVGGPWDGVSVQEEGKPQTLDNFMADISRCWPEIGAEVKVATPAMQTLEEERPDLEGTGVVPAVYRLTARETVGDEIRSMLEFVPHSERS